MGGLGLLVVFIAYIWLAAASCRWAYRHCGRLIALAIALVLLALPFVDAVVGRVVLKAKCAENGSVVVNESVSGVKGIGVGYGVFPDSPAHYGYQYVEGGHAYKAPWMYERAEHDPATGKTQIKKKVEPQAIYVLVEGPRQDSAYFFRTRTSINERLTGREIASFEWFAFRGGWAEQLAMSFSDAGPGETASCGDWNDKHEKTVAMLHSALRPAPTTFVSGQSAPVADVTR
jgi:hypothetical protein